MPGTILTLQVRRPPAEMPDADTDVLIWEEGWPEAQLGAYIDHDEDGAVWHNAQGECVKVVAWAELPVLSDAPATLTTKTGDLIALGGQWKAPA